MVEFSYVLLVEFFFTDTEKKYAKGLSWFRKARKKMLHYFVKQPPISLHHLLLKTSLELFKKSMVVN